MIHAILYDGLLLPVMIVSTATHLTTSIAVFIQCQYSRSQSMPAITNKICSKMASDTTTTRWNSSFGKFRTASRPFYEPHTSSFCQYSTSAGFLQDRELLFENTSCTEIRSML